MYGFEVNDRVILSEECITHLESAFGKQPKEEWGIDIRSFGEGTIRKIGKDGLGLYHAIVDWDNPQTLTYEDPEINLDRLLNEIALQWLEKVA